MKNTYNGSFKQDYTQDYTSIQKRNGHVPDKLT
uniref:Uncharacterized protein n=1 Tax=Rhizophora mucronata TaxID=61149 RepID=A0A2P2P5H6_RHIMU